VVVCVGDVPATEGGEVSRADALEPEVGRRLSVGCGGSPALSLTSVLSLSLPLLSYSYLLSFLLLLLLLPLLFSYTGGPAPRAAQAAARTPARACRPGPRKTSRAQGTPAGSGW
jgi:hypothetical protein